MTASQPEAVGFYGGRMYQLDLLKFDQYLHIGVQVQYIGPTQ